MDSPDTILVTGGAGYIGTQVALELADHGHRVVILDDLSHGRLLPVHERFRVVVGDVRDRELLADVLEACRVRAVVHMAASISVPESVRDPLGYYDNNVTGTLRLLEACTAAGVEALVFSSTAAVYGEVRTGPVHEEMPVAPANPYGASKAMAERTILDARAAGGPRYGILRYFNVAGADPRGRCGPTASDAHHLIRVACRTALGLQPSLAVFGTDWPTRDGTGVRDYIHVADLAALHRLLLEHLLAGGEDVLVNCGYGRGFSVREVVAAVERVAGRPLPVVTAPRRPGDVAELVAATDRLRRRFSWRPRWDDLETIVRHALAWEARLAGVPAPAGVGFEPAPAQGTLSAAPAPPAPARSSAGGGAWGRGGAAPPDGGPWDSPRW